MRSRRSARLSSGPSQDDSASREEQNPGRNKRLKNPPICKPTQWVAVLPESVCKPSAGEAKSRITHSFMHLIDPKTGSKRQYLVSPESQQICEVLKCSDEPRSWFIGDTVQTDGGLLVCTPVDPLFLALPYLTEAAKSGKFTTLEAILHRDDTLHSGSSILEQYVESDQWKHICDVKVLNELIVYRYNEEKTMKWLRKKVDLLSARLQEQQVQVGAGSHSSALVKTKKHSSVTKEDYLRYACEITCEYLNKEMSTMLSHLYSVKDMKRTQEDLMDQPPTKKRRTDSLDSGFSSQQQSSLEENDSSQQLDMTTAGSSSEGGCGPLEDYTKYNPSKDTAQSITAKKLTKSQKALSKVDKKRMPSLFKMFEQGKK